MKTVFTEHGWDDYVHWVETDRRMVRRINRLIEESKRDPFGGIGKPEPLRGDLSGYWSRRIDEEHRLVYRVKGDELTVVQARYHYEEAVQRVHGQNGVTYPARAGRNRRAA